MANDTLTIKDNRTGKEYEVPIENDTIKAMDLRQIKVNDADFGMMSYDPGFKNTANTKSTITLVDGGNGILRYRGYPIEQLAESSTFLEVAYLILNGELPSKDAYEKWVYDITHHTIVHENIKDLMSAFRYDAHPMGMFISTVAALSTFYSDSGDIFNEEARDLNITRLIAKVPTIAAFSYRHLMGFPYKLPDNNLSYTGNFLSMMFKMAELRYEPNPALERALDVLFILHADHEQNCSTTTMRTIGSSQADPYSALAGAAGALYGPLHGGANEKVLRMLREIGDVKNVPDYVERAKKGEFRLMGFGHRVYKNYDPRAKFIKKVAEDVFEVTGRSPLIDIAVELERIALEDDYFVERKLYPNVDFYSGIIYEAMGFPVSIFPVLFAVPRTVGWLAQWQEMLADKEQPIARPRQVYLGEGERDYVAMDKR
ncbi:MAG: citrate synthase [Chloroflexi bacterium]|nr:MAG: citrate synthase [Chloroflexota bacterium]MBL1193505.1 citrate synthase [Chloroflexota bacterium]NOH10796.1 citrate synthase [Chloroflexota bacterium]